MGRESRANPHGRDTNVLNPPIMRDALGRVLDEGDRVILRGSALAVFTVERIGPVVDPRMPPNLIDMDITCSIRFRARAGDVNAQFIRVITREEYDATTAQLKHAEAPETANMPDGAKDTKDARDEGPIPPPVAGPRLVES